MPKRWNKITLPLLVAKVTSYGTNFNWGQRNFSMKDVEELIDVKKSKIEPINLLCRIFFISYRVRVSSRRFSSHLHTWPMIFFPIKRVY